jgi:alpha-beta hydrolase superfamily lysophospholipase
MAMTKKKIELMELSHLVDACGEDPKRLASLALLLALAGVGLQVSAYDSRAAGASGNCSEAYEAARAQLLDFSLVVRDLESRFKAPH